MPGRFLAAPLQIFEVWQGGMSFHGGMLGVAIVIVWYCQRQHIPVLGFAAAPWTLARLPAFD